MLNVAVSEVILNEPRVRALVGQGEAASVAQHMRMGKWGKGRDLDRRAYSHSWTMFRCEEAMRICGI